MKFRMYLSVVVYLLVLCFMQIPSLAQSNNILPHWMDWSDDGSKLVVVTYEGLTAYDSAFKETGFRAFPENATYEFSPPNISPDSTKILVNKEIWDASTLQTLLTIDADVSIYSPQWSNDSTSIAFHNIVSGGTSIYSAEDGILLRQFLFGSWQTGYEYGAAWSPNNRYFAITGGRNTVVILDAITGADVARYSLVDEVIELVVWSPDNTHLALTTWKHVPLGTSGSYTDAGDPSEALIHSVIVLNVSDGQIITTITGLRDGIREVVWSPDGSQLAGYDTFRTLYIWDADTGNMIDSYLTPPYAVNLLKYSPYGGRLILGFGVGEPVSKRDDNPPIPTSTFLQPALGESIQFVAPDASPNKLQEILSQCVTDQTAITTGRTFINAGQYSAFSQWVNQLPNQVMPQVCASDLQLVAETIMN